LFHFSTNISAFLLDLITVLLFSVYWQTVYCENANAIPSLSPINLLLLLLALLLLLVDQRPISQLRNNVDTQVKLSKGLSDIYTILNLECCKCAWMRFHCANGLVALRICLP